MSQETPNNRNSAPTPMAQIIDTSNDALAQAAIAPIEPTMIVGLGTGRAATRAIHALAALARDGKFKGACVATSQRSATLGRSLGLNVTAMETTDRVDYLFDGADEVDPNLNLLKGGGGAMTCEKVVAHASAKRVYMVQSTKLVPRLGHTFRLPVEVLPYARSSARLQLEKMGLPSVVRASDTGMMLTDSGHHILDALVPQGIDLHKLNADLNALPGIVDHGLFLQECDQLIIENANDPSQPLEQKVRG